MYRIIDLSSEITGDEDRLGIAAVNDKGDIAGYLIFSADGDVVWIQDILVESDYRRDRIASLLVDELLERMEDSHIFHSLQVTYSDQEEYADLKAFVEGSYYFETVPEGVIYVLDPRMRKGGERYEKFVESGGMGVTVGEVTTFMKKEFYRALESIGLGLISEEDEADLALDLSFVAIHEGKISAGIFLKRPREGETIVEYAVALPGHHNAIGGLMASAIQKFESMYPEDTLVINTLNTGSEGLVKKLFGNVKGYTVYTGIAFPGGYELDY